MFWRFGFSSTSTLDTLLDKPNVSLEEILDEDELLQECKTQNSKLVNYLQQPRVLKRLFEHVVGTAEVGGPGGREWEEKVRFKYPYICSEVLSCDIWSIVDTTLSNKGDLLTPFWDAVLSVSPSNNQPSLPHHMHPLFASPPSTGPSSPRLNATNLPTVPGEDRDEESTGNVGVLGLETKRDDDKISARDNGPGKSVLAGYWAKVNGTFLDKKPKELLAFIRDYPGVIEKFVAHLEIPAVVDLLYRIIQCEESIQDVNVVDWLSGQDLIPRVVNLLSPSHTTDLHNTVSELLKAIIALSAPSPANLTQGQGAGESFAFGNNDTFGNTSGTSVCGVNNRLVRELASEPIVKRLVGFMLDEGDIQNITKAQDGDEMQRRGVGNTSSSLTGAQEDEARESGDLTQGPNKISSDESAIVDEEDDIEVVPARSERGPQSTAPSIDTHRNSIVTIRPGHIESATQAPRIAVTAESRTSSLVTCIGVLIELIRKNNSDYFEQHLFHTLRTHLLQRQQEIAERKAKEKGEKIEDEAAQEDEEDDEMEGMEEAMAELSDKLGIVHLGPMLRILCEHLPDFQRLITQPRSKSNSDTATNLTFERYRITELYAELLHCSNMSLLNRAPGEGPQYNGDGVLLGGIEGLQVLARTLQGGDASSPESVNGEATETGDPTSSVKRNSIAPKEESGDPKAEGVEAELAKTDALEARDSNGSHSRDRTQHTRESSMTGKQASNGSEDTDDEALLSEVSLNESTVQETTITEDTDSLARQDEPAPAEEKQSLDTASPQVEEGTAPPSPPSDVRPMADNLDEMAVGDILKLTFMRSSVIPTILTLFFSYPWNNFLHNVVYDILQQFFNGRMDSGLNRRLTLAVFNDGLLTEKIINGHERNEESLKGPRRIRMGYMGHMNLIAEETVKLFERYPDEIERVVRDHIPPEWNVYVNETLKENREKEAAPLAGGRPQMLHSMNFAAQQSSMSDSGAGLRGAMGSNAANDSADQTTNNDAFASYLTSQMGAGSTSDDDDDSDEDGSWLSQDMKRKQAGHGSSNDAGFDDAFAPSSTTTVSSVKTSTSRRGHQEDDDEEDFEDQEGEDMDDDEWGPFADSNQTDDHSRTQQASSSAEAYLTPNDWVSNFRKTSPSVRSAQTRQADETGGGDDDEDEEGESTFENIDVNSDENSADTAQHPTALSDMLDKTHLGQSNAVAAAHARRPSLGQHEGPLGESEDVKELKRRASSGSAGSSDPSVAQASDVEEPLGPGVSADARTDEKSGMIERTIDGKQIRVPLDDVALMAAQQAATPAANENAVEDD